MLSNISNKYKEGIALRPNQQVRKVKKLFSGTSAQNIGNVYGGVGDSSPSNSQ